MTDQELLSLYLVGGLIIIVVTVNLIGKWLGISIKERGVYYKAYLEVAQNFNLAEKDFSIDERYAKVNHIERLRFTRVGTVKPLSVFAGNVGGVQVELIDIKKARYYQETLVIMALSDHHHERKLRFLCSPIDSFSRFYAGGHYKEYETIKDQQLRLNKKYKSKNSNNLIWQHLSTNEITRLNELAGQYREFEVIIENGKFNFLMERQKVQSDHKTLKFFEEDCKAITLIVELALELREMFANAAAALELENR